MAPNYVEIKHTGGPHLSGPYGRHLWHGDLALDNLEKVGELFKQVLTGKRFTWVASNGYFAFRPEVRVERCESVKWDVYEGEGENPRRWGGLTVNDTYGLAAIHTFYETEREAREKTHSDEGWKNRVSIDICESGIQVEHYNVGGDLLWWTWAVDREQEPEYRTAAYDLGTRSTPIYSAPFATREEADERASKRDRTYVEERWVSRWEEQR